MRKYNGQAWCVWRWRNVFTKGEHYITRLYLVRCPWFQIALQHIKRPDDGRHMHDHERGFVSFILKGWYREEREIEPSDPYDPGGQPWKLSQRRRWVNVVPWKTPHRITEVSPGGVWTLMFQGRRRSSWGFYHVDGVYWTDWKEYLDVSEY